MEVGDTEKCRQVIAHMNFPFFVKLDLQDLKLVASTRNLDIFLFRLPDSRRMSKYKVNAL